MKISYVIPVYNNQSTLEELSKELDILSQQMSWDYEIVFVNDCSKDNSLQVLQSIKRSNIKIIHLTKNFGQSTAVLLGLKFADGDFVVSMDADLQDEPSFIPTLIASHANNTDVVFSGRAGRYESKSKIFSAKGFKYVIHLLSNKRLPVDACMFFAIKKEATNSLLPYCGSKPYLLSLIARKKLRCISVPYVRKPNKLNQSNYTFIRRWKVGIKGVLNFFIVTPKKFSESFLQID